MIVDRSDEALFRFLRQVRDMFGKGAEVLFEHHEREGYHNDYIDVRITPGTVP